MREERRGVREEGREVYVGGEWGRVWEGVILTIQSLVLIHF